MFKSPPRFRPGQVPLLIRITNETSLQIVKIRRLILMLERRNAVYKIFPGVPHYAIEQVLDKRGCFEKASMNLVVRH